MLSEILSWFGLGSSPRKSRHTRSGARPTSATAHLFEKRTMERPPETRPAGGDDNGFNPYNTGKFDRSASWEKISKSQR